MRRDVRSKQKDFMVSYRMARKLADQIEGEWHKKGHHEVRAFVVAEAHPGPGKNSNIFCVRSNLVDLGLV